jgi:hypothetical protein
LSLIGWFFPHRRSHLEVGEDVRHSRDTQDVYTFFYMTYCTEIGKSTQSNGQSQAKFNISPHTTSQ